MTFFATIVAVLVGAAVGIGGTLLGWSLPEIILACGIVGAIAGALVDTREGRICK